MKHIGILTLVFDNYGTRLQSYALVKAIKCILGEECKVNVIDLSISWGGEKKSNNGKNQLYSIITEYGIFFPRKIIEAIRWRLQSKKISDDIVKRQNRKILFEEFCQRIPYTSKKYTCDDLREGKVKDFDAIVIGSDQVWNMDKVGNEDIFFGDFPAHGTKFLTYAASFGLTKIASEKINIYSKRIKKFTNILVREDEGLAICNRLGKKDCHVVLDPTLLFNKNDYINDFLLNPLVDDSYILVYSLNHSLEIYNEAYKIACSSGARMVALKRDICPPCMDKYENSIEFYDISPEGFLSLIANAKCIVTNSYHAMLFSINFERNYYLFLSNADEENSRFISLSKKLGLEKRVFMATEKLPEKIENIDYFRVNRLLNMLRKQSIQLLNDSLKSIG